MLYVELGADGEPRHPHYAPYLGYRPLADGEPAVDAILEPPECAWLDRGLEQKAQGYAVAHVVPEHFAEVRDARLALIGKTEAAVKDRPMKEIGFWDSRAEQLQLRRGGRQDRGRVSESTPAVEFRTLNGMAMGENQAARQAARRCA